MLAVLSALMLFALAWLMLTLSSSLHVVTEIRLLSLFIFFHHGSRVECSPGFHSFLAVFMALDAVDKTRFLMILGLLPPSSIRL